MITSYKSCDMIVLITIIQTLHLWRMRTEAGGSVTVMLQGIHPWIRGLGTGEVISLIRPPPGFRRLSPQESLNHANGLLITANISSGESYDIKPHHKNLDTILFVKCGFVVAVA